VGSSADERRARSSSRNVCPWSCGSAVTERSWGPPPTLEGYGRAHPRPDDARRCPSGAGPRPSGGGRGRATHRPGPPGGAGRAGRPRGPGPDGSRGGRRQGRAGGRRATTAGSRRVGGRLATTARPPPADPAGPRTSGTVPPSGGWVAARLRLGPGPMGPAGGRLGAGLAGRLDLDDARAAEVGRRGVEVLGHRLGERLHQQRGHPEGDNHRSVAARRHARRSPAAKCGRLGDDPASIGRLPATLE
jgi:hypothetical protein